MAPDGTKTEADAMTAARFCLKAMLKHPEFRRRTVAALTSMMAEGYFEAIYDGLFTDAVDRLEFKRAVFKVLAELERSSTGVAVDRDRPLQ